MKQVSIWADSVTPPDFERLSGTHRCDVAVAGGGLTGLTAALLLRRAGARVCVAEAGRLGGGTSGRTTAKVTIQHGTALSGLADEKARAYMQANAAGLDLVAALATELGADCGFERAAACVYARNDAEERAVMDELHACERLGVQARLVTRTRLPFPVRCALTVENQAQIHPLKYLYALAGELGRQGADIFEQTPVRRIDRDDHGVTLHTEGGEIRAKTAVLATGYPLVEFPGLFFMRLHQERSYVIAAKSAQESLDMSISAGAPIHSMRTLSMGGGSWLLAGGFGHKTGKEDGAESTGLHPLGDFLHKHFPAARAYCGWSAQDCVTLDGMPYVGGLYHKGPQVYVATGYAKWGMTNSAAAAMMIADDFAGRQSADAQARAFFSPLRVAPTASARQFFVQTADTVRGFAGHVDLPGGSYDDVAAGEGAVFRADGRAVAVGRDREGALHVFRPRCTHMGCALEYNEESRSFDCPCHGSRFSLCGAVLSGPAKKPLEPLEDE